MSLQSQAQEQTAELSKLIIPDHPYQFLPNLAAIYGDTCAVMMQQLHYTIQHPWFEGESLNIRLHNQLVYIQLWPFMWFDTLEGITRHLARSTFYRYRKSLIECSAWSVLPTLGEGHPNSSKRNDDESSQWYAIDHGVVHRHDVAYRDAFEAALAERRAQRAAIKYHEAGAHWRPTRGEDTSKQLDQWRACLSEHWEEPMPKQKIRGGKRVKEDDVDEIVESAQSHFEIESISLDSKDAEEPIFCAGQGQSQNEIGVISHPVQSQNEIACESQNEIACESQNETAPYKKTLSLESDTDDTASPKLSPADADAEAESNLILSGNGTTEKPQEAKRSQEAQQIALPETAATEIPLPLPEPAASLAARWIEIAADEYGLSCSEELAARIVCKSPLATLSDKAVVRLIGADCNEIGLEKPLFGAAKQELVADVPQLRWLLFVWPGHLAEVEAWAARKNRSVNLAGAFVTKWEENQAPPRDWVAAQISAIRAEMRAEAVAQEEAHAKDVWDGLSPPQRELVKAEGAKRAAERGGGNWNDRVEREGRERRALLLNADYVASLPDLVEEAEAPPVTPTEAVTPQKYQPNAAELATMNLHAQKLLPRVRRGDLDLDAAEDHAIGQWYYVPKQAALLREIIEALLSEQQLEVA